MIIISTSFPNTIQTFPTMKDLTESDMALVKQFQTAMQSGDLATAQAILVQIPDYQQKIISTNLMNTAWDTLTELQKYFYQKYSPAYVVSDTVPENQEVGDYWFKVKGWISD